MLILDTDHLTIIQRRTEPAYANLIFRLEAVSSSSVCTTIINFEEQMRGWLSLISSSKEVKQEIAAYYRLNLLRAFFNKVLVLDYTAEAAEHFSKLLSLKLRVGSMDLRIAAIAISQQSLLLSRNLIDFQKVPGLHVEDWTK